MRCPKCSHEQADTVECAACGLIFDRYQRHIDRQQEQKADGAGRSASPGGSAVKVAAVALLMLATAGVTTYLVRPGGEEPATPPESAQQQIPAAAPPAAATAPAPAPTAAANQEAPVAKGSSIEEARNATVSLETPWGTGSGFFVNAHYIVTNRHVIEIDEQALAEARSQVETVRKLVELEQQKLEQLRQEMRKMPEGPTRKQLALILQAREGELAKILPQLEEGEGRLEAMEKGGHASDITIILADGREFKADFLQVSSRNDLALLALHTVESPHLRRDPQARRLQQGEKVYTIGSPVGLRHTVTSGIFSGYRERTSDGRVLLQTDAPINPGNSGGPLIGLDGHVIGVNNQMIARAQLLGFAIPAETAKHLYEEMIATGETIIRRATLRMRTSRHTFTGEEQRRWSRRWGARIIAEPSPDSPAGKAGLRAGDVVVGFDGTTVTEPGDLLRLLNRQRIDRECQITFVRDDLKQHATIVPVERTSTSDGSRADEH